MSPSAAASSSEAPKRALNPFLNSVFGNPLDENPTDVSEINAAAFQKCRELVERVRDQKSTQVLLLFGEPGSGKTHLLSRLRASLEKDSQAGREALFIPNRMVTSASMLWRFLRRNLTAALVRQRAFERVIKRSKDEISEQDRNLGIVLGNLMDGVHYADSVAWLRGDDLPEEVMKGLRLSATGDEEEQEAASRRIVTTICGLGEPIPFVFCFDQMEALQSYRDDKEGYFKLGQVVSDLHDSTHNLAIFSCLQTSVMPEFEGSIRAADRDRLMRQRAGLMGLKLDEAMKLIRARVDSVAELRGTMPIRESDIKDLFEADGLCVARKVIVRCQEVFDKRQQTPAEPVEPLDDKLERDYRNLQRTPRVEDAEGILRVALPSILYLRGIKMTLPTKPNTVVDGVISGKKPAATVICNQRPGLPLIKRLERARADWQASGAPGLVILRDARNAIGAGAVRTREVVEKLEREGARFVSVKAEALSALEAISRLLANARSGDLTYRGESVPAASVETWLSGHMPRAVDELLDEIGGEHAAAPDDLAQMLTDLLAKAKIVSLDDAAAQLGKTAEEVEECGRRNTSLIGFAGGSKRVLFRVVERQQTEEVGD